MVTVPDTVAPAEGDVIDTDGGVVSGTALPTVTALEALAVFPAASLPIWHFQVSGAKGKYEGNSERQFSAQCLLRRGAVVPFNQAKISFRGARPDE
jgi:hypothetical protein